MFNRYLKAFYDERAKKKKNNNPQKKTVFLCLVFLGFIEFGFLGGFFVANPGYSATIASTSENRHSL